MKNTIALIAVGFLLAACSTWSGTERSATQTTQVSSESVLPGVPAEQTVHIEGLKELPIDYFPTASVKPRGKSWRHMHSNGFTGDYDLACKLMRLSFAQCATYKRMHSTGECRVMDVPNGTVLNYLVFTDKWGNQHVQKNVKVDLKNPSTRKTEVCDLGGGVYAMRFHGCGNHALVRVKLAPLPKMKPPGPPLVSGACRTPKVRVFAFDPSAIEHVPGLKEDVEAVKERSFTDPDSTSRKFGRPVYTEYTNGVVKTMKKPTRVRLSYVRQNPGGIPGDLERKEIGTYSIVGGKNYFPVPEIVTGRWSAVSVEYLDAKRDHLVSPQHSSETGLYELMFFPKEFMDPKICVRWAMAFQGE